MPGAKDGFHALLRVLKFHRTQQEHMTSFLCLICLPPTLDWRAQSLKLYCVPNFRYFWCICLVQMAFSPSVLALTPMNTCICVSEYVRDKAMWRCFNAQKCYYCFVLTLIWGLVFVNTCPDTINSCKNAWSWYVNLIMCKYCWYGVYIASCSMNICNFFILLAKYPLFANIYM